MRYKKMKKILTQIGTLNSLMMGDYNATITISLTIKKRKV